MHICPLMIQYLAKDHIIIVKYMRCRKTIVKISHHIYLLYLYIYIYINRQLDRQTDRQIDTLCTYTHTCIYIFICMYICIYIYIYIYIYVLYIYICFYIYLYICILHPSYILSPTNSKQILVDRDRLDIQVAPAVIKRTILRHDFVSLKSDRRKNSQKRLSFAIVIVYSIKANFDAVGL